MAIMLTTTTTTTTTTFFLFLLVINSLLYYQSLARPRNPNSLILGLAPASRASLPSLPKASTSPRKKPTDVLDMMEPLREVRDGYLISLSIGTPPQVIQVYMDTGSDLTWVPCGNISFDCIECNDYKNNRMMASFSPSHSSSSYRDSCTSPFCVDVHSSDNPLDPCTMAGCSLSNIVKAKCSWPCPSFAYTYGAGGVVTGTLTRDTLRVHGRFGRGALSLPSQLGFLQKGFSHCFLPFRYANNPNFSSPLVIGDTALTSKEDMQFTPMLKSPMYPNYYYVGLEAITVGNVSAIEVPSSLREFDSLGNGGMLVDSGTTYTHLPEPFYSQVLSVLQSLISYPRATEMEMRTGFDLCYKLPCQNNSILTGDLLPSITFHFLNNVSLVLSRGNHFYAMSAPY
ncbi:CHLOROPLAST NUCLEOID DNA-BINDING PROTEIN-LIKE [Salix koriyanagi]|uniref:CHLOROPLAST NUCLEOID DNA-BINDING PROTEIN-LIKE n=1 Tax=Salix koriyanagi TaxID=2511006 RepID=A0A9Q1AAU2_9ROSI|nr:CHLOROPLAST NUCLEOID DNA-BINDING PROTEIN-LIKE [Salix koriyanagi]